MAAIPPVKLQLQADMQAMLPSILLARCGCVLGSTAALRGLLSP